LPVAPPSLILVLPPAFPARPAPPLLGLLTTSLIPRTAPPRLPLSPHPSLVHIAPPFPGHPLSHPSRLASPHPPWSSRLALMGRPTPPTLVVLPCPTWLSCSAPPWSSLPHPTPPSLSCLALSSLGRLAYPLPALPCSPRPAPPWASHHILPDPSRTAPSLPLSHPTPPWFGLPFPGPPLPLSRFVSDWLCFTSVPYGLPSGLSSFLLHTSLPHSSPRYCHVLCPVMCWSCVVLRSSASFHVLLILVSLY
jgi:hypothetical protein